MKRTCAIASILILGLGCKSHPLGPYISPAVTGQVVAADSGKPLAGVRVIRGKARPDALTGQPKGGQLLMARPPVETARDGTFSLSSERVLSIFRGSGWNEVRLTFEKPGYLRLQTNVPTALATNVGSEPVLSLNRIALHPAEPMKNELQ